MNWNTKRSNTIIGIILIILASIIGPEIIIPGEPGEPVPVQKSKSISLPDTYPLKIKTHKVVEKIDEEIFLKSFKRQSNLKLIKCLKVDFPDKSTITLLARLSKKGKLTHIVTPLSKDGLPNCVTENIEVMNFIQLTSELKSSYIEISWRVDW